MKQPTIYKSKLYKKLIEESKRMFKPKFIARSKEDIDKAKLMNEIMNHYLDNKSFWNIYKLKLKKLKNYYEKENCKVWF